MKILIIEDDPIKIEKLSKFFVDEDILIKESFHSGLRELLKNSSIDLLILDMSLPLWENADQGIGYNDEQFGGTNILRELKRKKKGIPTILVTMFDVFSDGNLTFEQLNQQLLNEYKPFYRGGVFYNASEDGWKEKLNFLVETIKQEKQND